MRFFFIFFVLFMSPTISAESWLEKNYDVHLSCKLEKACNTRSGNCAFPKNTISFHFSLDTDINSYLKYRTCTEESRPYQCYEDYSDRDNKDGIWICQGPGCVKGVITSINPNEISAIDWLGLYEKDINWDGTVDTSYGKRPSNDVVEYVFDRTKGTMIENWIDGCWGDGSCAGAWLNHGLSFPLHEKRIERYHSCQKINKIF